MCIHFNYLYCAIEVNVKNKSDFISILDFVHCGLLECMSFKIRRPYFRFPVGSASCSAMCVFVYAHKIHPSKALTNNQNVYYTFDYLFVSHSLETIFSHLFLLSNQFISVQENILYSN